MRSKWQKLMRCILASFDCETQMVLTIYISELMADVVQFKLLTEKDSDFQKKMAGIKEFKGGTRSLFVYLQ